MSMFERYGYLFLTDICDLPQHPYTAYDAKEPGYSEAMLQAYQAAFTQSIDHKISPDFPHAVRGEFQVRKIARKITSHYMVNFLAF